MNGYKISEAARATGFTESALRFYEKESVVVPERTSTGYRNYADDDLEALRFVARGKQLGLSLDEVTELLQLLDDDECAPIQARIRDLVSERIGQAQDRIAELVGFTAQLQQAVSGLGAHTPDGACDDQCGCKSASGSHGHVAERDLIPLAGSSSRDVACSLHPDLVGGRIDDWNRALGSAVEREAIAGGLRIHFNNDVDITGLAKLAAAEQTCCSFFEFRFTIGRGGVSLDVVGPDDAQDVITAVFGAAA